MNKYSHVRKMKSELYPYQEQKTKYNATKMQSTEERDDEN